MLTKWRLKWYPRTLLLAIGLAFLVVVATASGSRTLLGGQLGFDYAAFYSSGAIVLNGDFDGLYSEEQQKTQQQELAHGAAYPFAYPPHVALAYAPFALIPYKLSYVLHTLLMTVLLGWSCVRLNRILCGRFDDRVLFFFWALTYFPMFRSIFGGQNTALILFFVVFCWDSVLKGRDYRAGLYLGLLMFKPQFAIPLAGLFFAARRWKICTGMAAVSLLTYALNSMLFGADWIYEWLAFVRKFAEFNALANFASAVSWLSFFRDLFGPNDPTALFLGASLACATILFIATVWFVGGRNADPGAQISMALPCIILLSPYSNFYDMGVLIFSYAMLLATHPRSDCLIAIFWTLGFVQLISPLIGISLSFFVLVVQCSAFVYLLLPRSGSLKRNN